MSRNPDPWASLTLPPHPPALLIISSGIEKALEQGRYGKRTNGAEQGGSAAAASYEPMTISPTKHVYVQ